MNNKDLCNICKESLNLKVYSPHGTQRGLSVYICSYCNLVQSLPRIETVNTNVKSTSSGANWGNIRYGKSFRTNSAINELTKYLDLHSVKRVLDIGSNRGHFLQNIFKLNSKTELWGIEPDRSIVSEYSEHNSINLIVDRVQNTKLPSKYFDLIYCSHTLEHLADPIKTLIYIKNLLSRSGIAYIEVPNLDFISHKYLVEEFFIDKHLYHFDQETFKKALWIAGLDIIKFETDESNLWAVAKSADASSEIELGKEKLKSSNFEKKVIQVSEYKLNLSKNHKKMRRIASRLENLCNKYRVCIWGGGRIFDALIQHGNFNPGNLIAVVDSELIKYKPTVHGVTLKSPDAILDLNPEVLIIASREYYNEIKVKATKLYPNLIAAYSIFELDDYLG